MIAGRPNVGKSSLLNRLAGEERAIVAAVPGTTRDALREPIEIDGVPLVVVDTAGLRISSDAVERMGIERTEQELARADAAIVVLDATGGAEETPPIPPDLARIEVYNKIDLVPGFAAPRGAIALSAKTGEGMDALRAAILRVAGWSSSGEPVYLARSATCGPWTRHEVISSSPPKSSAGSFSRRNCASRTARSVRSRASSTSSTCLEKSSRASASVSN